MIVEIADNALAFDPLLVPESHVTSAREDRYIGGPGIFQIQKVTDPVTYRYGLGKKYPDLNEKKCSLKKPVSRGSNAPLRANPAPGGGGGACDASVLPVQKFPVFFVYR
jgi:hypothetical protein